MMYFSFQFKDISDFERESFKKRFTEELAHILEILALLEDVFADLKFSKKIYLQRIKAKRLASALEDKLRQLEIERHLKMLSLSLYDMKMVRKALRKRMIAKIDPESTQEHLAFLEEKIKEEIYREEFGLSQGLKSFPVSHLEVDILLETIAV